MTISVYESSGTIPVTYLLNTGVRASSGTVATEFFTFNAAEKYKRIALSNQNVLEIRSCKDSEGNDGYEVPF